MRQRSRRACGVAAMASIGLMATAAPAPTAAAQPARRLVAAAPIDVSPADVTVGQTTPVVISAVLSANVGRPGAPGALRIGVRNTTPSAIDEVEIRFELRNGFAFDPSGSPSTCRAPNTQVVCELDTLAGGATAPLAIALVATDPDAVLGTRLDGVLLAPLSALADLGAGELLEDGPAGGRIVEALPTNVSSTRSTRRWTTEVRPIFSSARLCAVGLDGTASLRVAGVGTASVTSTGGVVTSSPLPTTVGTVQPIEIETTATEWTSIGLIGDGEPCTAAASGAVGVDGRWRYRLPVEMTVGSTASVRPTGAVWGTRAGQAISSVRVRNAGPDPAILEARLEEASSASPPVDPASACVLAPGSTTATCRPGAVPAGASSTITVARGAGTNGAWTVRALNAAEGTERRMPST